MNLSKCLELFCIVQCFLVFVNGQQGETCASRIEKLWPRQRLDLDRLTGEWMAIQLIRMNESLVEEPFAKCASQIITRQPDSENLNIRLKFDIIDGGGHIERDGQVNVTSDETAIWKWGYFDNPAQFWEGVVIATDYVRYWIHYECEELNGFRIETVLFRHRDRVVGPGQVEIYQSLMEGLGFPLANLVDIPQPAECNVVPTTMKTKMSEISQ